MSVWWYKVRKGDTSLPRPLPQLGRRGSGARAVMRQRVPVHVGEQLWYNDIMTATHTLKTELEAVRLELFITEAQRQVLNTLELRCKERKLKARLAQLTREPRHNTQPREAKRRKGQRVEKVFS